jgi:hypothetical protein
MSLPIRRTLVVVSVILFLVILGPVLFYTFGYRFSFADLSIRTTGGFFINTTPVRATVHINDKKESTSFITGDLFVQNLRPGSQHIVVEKNGYYSWEKHLMIEPHTVKEAYVVLVPKEGATTTLATGPFSALYGSPSGRYLIALEPQTSTMARITLFDTQTVSRIEPVTRQSSDLLSIPQSTLIRPFWHTERIALFETDADWRLLSISQNGSYTVESLYAQSELSSALPKKPDVLIPHPTNSRVYFVLSDTSLFIWDAAAETLQPALETIAGIAVHENKLISLDAAYGNLYASTLSTGNAKLISTSSISISGTANIYQTETAYIISNNDTLWLVSKTGNSVESLAEELPHSRIITNNMNIIWWKGKNIWVRWTMLENELPYFVEELETRLYSGTAPIRRVFYYPGEHYLIFTEGNAVKVIELDGRSGSHNIATLYEGTRPIIFVPQNKKTVSIIDDGVLFEMGLE